MALNPRIRVLLVATLLALSLTVLIRIIGTRRPAATPVTPINSVPPPAVIEDVATPPPLLLPGASPSLAPSSTPPAAPPVSSDSNALLIPVAGVKPSDLRDTYNDARSEGRTHNAIDIIAPRGTPVVACADGRIVKLFNSEKGGITIYQLSADERMLYYYAHLERYADGLREQTYARRGELLGYVGDTGNAVPGNYHLHFEVSAVADPTRYWESVSLNPYPLLTGGN